MESAIECVNLTQCEKLIGKRHEITLNGNISILAIVFGWFCQSSNSANATGTTGTTQTGYRCLVFLPGTDKPYSCSWHPSNSHMLLSMSQIDSRLAKGGKKPLPNSCSAVHRVAQVPEELQWGEGGCGLGRARSPGQAAAPTSAVEGSARGRCLPSVES